MLISRRTVIVGVASAVLVPSAGLGHVGAFKLDAKYEPQRVSFSGYPTGTIVVDPANRFLYFMEDSITATRYGVGVGRAGLAFKGRAVVGRKAEWPWWRPTDNMIRRSPKKYARYAKGMPGGPRNPLGARALYLYRDGSDTMFRIHGTTEPWSIGQAVSNGCIRMINDHVITLYERVPIGTPVVVI
jgi:lipoprotein-anchoring transpeptidase ErfK/SrfK